MKTSRKYVIGIMLSVGLGFGVATTYAEQTPDVPVGTPCPMGGGMGSGMMNGGMRQGMMGSGMMGSGMMNGGMRHGMMGSGMMNGGMRRGMMGTGMMNGGTRQGMMGNGMAPGMRQGGAGPNAAFQQLMTPEERSAMIEKMRNAKTPEERQKIAAENRAEMEKRAKDKGITLPPARNPYFMPGPNPG